MRNLIFFFFLVFGNTSFGQIMAIHGMAAVSKSVLTDADLLPGFTRLVPNPTYFTTTDNKIYTLKSGNMDTELDTKLVMSGDGVYLTKPPVTLGTGGDDWYGCDMILITGSGQTDIYFMYNTNPGKAHTYVDSGSGGNLSVDITAQTWYGLKRDGTNIKAVSTTDGVNFITIADFGSRVGGATIYTYGTSYNNSTNRLYHPQGIGVVSAP